MMFTLKPKRLFVNAASMSRASAIIIQRPFVCSQSPASWRALPFAGPLARPALRECRAGDAAGRPRGSLRGK